MVFSFNSWADVDKVLSGEPWSIDRHLIVFRRIDGVTPIHELDFSTVYFWVQIHNIPFSLMTTEVAVSLGESIGKVTLPSKDYVMHGGEFMRVRVAVNVLEPLCRGRRVTLNDDSNGWVSFRYERLPNFCFWCGHLDHMDKQKINKVATWKKALRLALDMPDSNRNWKGRYFFVKGTDWVCRPEEWDTMPHGFDNTWGIVKDSGSAPLALDFTFHLFVKCFNVVIFSFLFQQMFIQSSQMSKRPSSDGFLKSRSGNGSVGI